jgi:hypothetical protein
VNVVSNDGEQLKKDSYKLNAFDSATIRQSTDKASFSQVSSLQIQAAKIKLIACMKLNGFRRLLRGMQLPYLGRRLQHSHLAPLLPPLPLPPGAVQYNRVQLAPAPAQSLPLS